MAEQEKTFGTFTLPQEPSIGEFIMEIKSSIEKRKELLKKVSSGKKLTKEEQFWINTNPAYSELGNGLLSYDIIRLTPNVKYKVRITCLNHTGTAGYTPVLSVPCGKGAITTEENIINIVDEKKETPITSLQTMNSNDNKEAIISYVSEIGCLKIHYSCEVKDHRGVLSYMPSTVLASLAMYKTQISPAKVVYKCKSPNGNSFTDYEFSIEWAEDYE